jgi:hypothetical protein
MPSLLVKRLELQDEIDVPPEIYNWFVPQNYAVSFYQRYNDPKNVILTLRNFVERTSCKSRVGRQSHLAVRVFSREEKACCFLSRD